MLRNLIVSAIFGPLIAGLAGFVLLVGYDGMRHGTASWSMDTMAGLLGLILCIAYIGGMVPALLVGLGNGLAGKIVRWRAGRLLIGAALGAAVVYACCNGPWILRDPAVAQSEPLVLYYLAGAIAGLSIAALGHATRVAR